MITMKSTLLAITTLMLVNTAAESQEGPLVGHPAPPFVAETCINRPPVVSSSALLGEVIVLEFWGTT